MELRQIKHIIPILLLVEYLWICLSGGSFSVLSNAPFFDIGADPIYWIFFLIKLPNFILYHPWLCFALDVFIIAILSYSCRNKTILVWLRILLFFFLLLHYITLTSVLGHRNYQSGYVWVALLFLFDKEIGRKWVFESLRYFVLLFYVTSFFLKIYYGGWLNNNHFLEILNQQWVYYQYELSDDFRLDLVSFLSQHNRISQLIFYLGMLIEFVPIIGFFTKRMDRFIFSTLMAFHICNWLLMDIAPIGQMSLLILLFISQPDDYPEK